MKTDIAKICKNIRKVWGFSKDSWGNPEIPEKGLKTSERDSNANAEDLKTFEEIQRLLRRFEDSS